MKTREIPRTRAPVVPRVQGGTKAHTALLLCGILASPVYAAMLAFVPTQWEGYSSVSQTVSELSAIGAPTRSLWVALGVAWTLLYAAFGWGVWRSARGNRRLRVVGGAIVAAAVLGLFWPPMHQREVLAAGGATLTDTLHIVWTVMNGLLTLLAMGFGAAALGMRFRVYSIGTMVILAAAGILTSTEAPGVSANLPTPWIGVWERINIGVWLLWVVVLAIVLLQKRHWIEWRAWPLDRRPCWEKLHLEAPGSDLFRADVRRLQGRHPHRRRSRGLLGTEETSSGPYAMAVLATLAGPSFAGIVLTGFIEGSAGLRELGSRFVRWRVGARWYAVALLTAPLLMMAVLLVLSLTSSEFLPLILTTDDRGALLLSGIIGGLAVGIFEELGWTGFAVPRLRRRHGVLGTGLIAGLLWGAWHFPSSREAHCVRSDPAGPPAARAALRVAACLQGADGVGLDTRGACC
jgi:membrane protease YdiL (CAAX protease family)